MRENEHGFFRHGDNAYLANFSEAEREVLTNLVEQIIELLAERVDSHTDDPLAAMVGITMHDTLQMTRCYYVSCRMHTPTKLMPLSFGGIPKLLCAKRNWHTLWL